MKYKTILAALLLHICVGSVYGWSCVLLPIVNQYGYTIAATQFCFSLAIFFLGTNTCFLGPYIEKYGAKKAASIAAILVLIGMTGTGIALYTTILGTYTIYLIYVFYGIIFGSGVGIAYLAPISALLAASDKHKALASAVAIFGFGLGSLIFAPVATILINYYSIPLMFIILGSIYGICMLISANLFDNTYTIVKQRSQGVTRSEAIHNKVFYYLWFIIFINIFCGISLISVTAPMSQQLALLSNHESAILVATVGLLNGFGRLLWAHVSDIIGRIKAYKYIFGIQIMVCLILLNINITYVYICGILILATTYGAGFSMLPALCTDIFGYKHVSAIHGAVLFSWAIAGITGPLCIIGLYMIFNTYISIFPILILLFIIAFILTTKLKKIY